MDCRGLLRAVLFFLIATIERFGSRHISIVTHGDRLPNGQNYKEKPVRISLLHFAAIGFLFGSVIGISSQAQEQAASPASTPHFAGESLTNPVADPRAVVVIGKARFTVLTPEMIRMEIGRAHV